MRTASVSETKNHLSALLEIVKQGEAVLIMERGHPVAKLEPLVFLSPQKTSITWLNQLERQGLLKRGNLKKCQTLEIDPPAALGSALEALLKERREGR